jgi:hypothetical protein
VTATFPANVPDPLYVLPAPTAKPLSLIPMTFSVLLPVDIDPVLFDGESNSAYEV